MVFLYQRKSIGLAMRLGFAPEQIVKAAPLFGSINKFVTPPDYEFP
jgi:hypothetical protein